MAERCAVIGVGQTHHKAKRDDVSIAGLVREAAKMALADADLTWSDIDAVVIGKAPDMFEGNMMPSCTWPRPSGGGQAHVPGPHRRLGGRIHRPGGVPPRLVGIHKRVLTVAYEKQSDSDAMWALSVPQPFAAPLLAGAGGTSPRTSGPTCGARAPRVHRSHGGGQGPPQRHAQPLRPPAPGRHRHEDGRGVDDAVGPLRYLEACPSSDGAAAMVLAAEDAVSGAFPRPGSTARPCARSPPCSPVGTRSTPRPGGTARRRLRPGRDHQPAGADRCGRGVRALQLVRAHVAGEPGVL